MPISLLCKSWRYDRAPSDDFEKGREEYGDQLLEPAASVTSDTSDSPPPRSQRPWAWFRDRKVTILNLGVLILTLALNFNQFEASWGRNWLLKQTSFYSPGLDWFDLPMHDVHYNGTFFMPENPPLSRQFPSPEVEIFWNEYDLQRVYAITEEQVVKLGKNPLSAARMPKEFGHGDDAYFAAFDVFHQLHCLNSLRKIAYKDYEPYPTVMKMRRPEFYWMHVAHCIDMLYENVKCNANMDMVTWVWREGQSAPTLDFNVMHQCRDWDTFIEFHEAHRLPKVNWSEVLRPEDPSLYENVPQEAGWWDYNGPNPRTDLPALPTIGLKKLG